MRERLLRAVAGAVGTAALAAVLAGCGGGGAGGGSGGSAAASSAPVPGGSAAPSPAATDAALWAKWGLKPLAPAPAPPADKPIKLSRTGPVPVFAHIPTDQKIAFITVDDGLVKDPKFIEMEQQLRIPITMFLMNDAIKDDYGYFKPLQALGFSIQNHTLHHPPMNTIPLAAQKNEICGDQKILTAQYGTPPDLFRPPYGAFDAATRTAVRACGPDAIVYWTDTMEISGIRYQHGKLRPGDIILAHFRGPAELKGRTMTEMFTAMVKRIEEQGFTVARLEDYIQPPGATG